VSSIRLLSSINKYYLVAILVAYSTPQHTARQQLPYIEVYPPLHGTSYVHPMCILYTHPAMVPHVSFHHQLVCPRDKLTVVDLIKLLTGILTPNVT
jgi:hypothetical protein